MYIGKSPRSSLPVNKGISRSECQSFHSNKTTKRHGKSLYQVIGFDLFQQRQRGPRLFGFSERLPWCMTSAVGAVTHFSFFPPGISLLSVHLWTKAAIRVSLSSYIHTHFSVVPCRRKSKRMAWSKHPDKQEPPWQFGCWCQENGCATSLHAFFSLHRENYFESIILWSWGRSRLLFFYFFCLLHTLNLHFFLTWGTSYLSYIKTASFCVNLLQTGVLWVLCDLSHERPTASSYIQRGGKPSYDLQSFLFSSLLVPSMVPLVDSLSF